MLTELDAVNKMLRSAGLAAVADAESTHPSYLEAKRALDIVNNDVQSGGAWYNKSIVTLEPTETGEVYVPQNATHCTPTSRDKLYLVIRGDRLFDTRARSYIIGEAIEVTLIEVLLFDELPDPAKQFICSRAVYEYYVTSGGADPKLSEFKNQLAAARLMYNKENLRCSVPIQPSFQRRFITAGIRDTN